MNGTVLIVIIIVIIALLYCTNALKYRNSRTEYFQKLNSTSTNQLCPSCNNINVTCKDGSGQTFYNDSRCLNPSTDPLMGLGCIGTTGCRYCGFGAFSSVKCPTNQQPTASKQVKCPAGLNKLCSTGSPYQCLGGIAVNGCAANSSYWDNTNACTSYCNVNTGVAPTTPPKPPITPPSSPPQTQNFKVNMVNECPVTVLAAALGPTKIQPANNDSWVLGPGQSLSLDIPKEWESTAGNTTVNGPRFWARTGCNYDTTKDMASCEGGDCGNKYDCSNAGLAGSPPGTWGEFCFNCGDGMTYYDVSLVDGAHMSMDIKPINPANATHPGNPSDPFWCKTGLCNQGQDLRDPNICPPEFRLENTDLKSHNPSMPQTTTACFSNCGKWAYLKGMAGPDVKCDVNKPEPIPENEIMCQNWRKYCCQSPSSGKPCKTDGDCQFSEACWNGSCQCRPFYRKECDPNICTHGYCQCDDTTSGNSGTTYPMLKSMNLNKASPYPMSKSTNLNKTIYPMAKSIGSNKPTIRYPTSKSIGLNKTISYPLPKSTYPPKSGNIGAVSCDPSKCPQGFDTEPKPIIGCTLEEGCIGDDTFHSVCPQSYSWPNNAQTYNCNAKEYTVTFCPGGTPIKMSESTSGIPDCSILKDNPQYGYDQAQQDCSISVQNGKPYACARKTADGLWACGIESGASCYNLGTLCKFDTSSSNN